MKINFTIMPVYIYYYRKSKNPLRDIFLCVYIKVAHY